MPLLRLLLLSLVLASCSTSHSGTSSLKFTLPALSPLQGIPTLKKSDQPALMKALADDSTLVWLWAPSLGDVYSPPLHSAEDDPFSLPADARIFNRVFTEQDLPALIALCDRELQRNPQSPSPPAPPGKHISATPRHAHTAAPAAAAHQRLLLFRSRLEIARTAFALRHRLHRNKPLPVLTHDRNNLFGGIVHSGSNFPLAASSTEHRVFIQFRDTRIILWLLVPKHHTEAGILRALTDASAPPVIVHQFTTRF
ncbi:hypothetical protein [Prosthecobacter sp.]|uniref:hypothetical protein n=1 Tax=Prosthecobacter sp. TaxID=1965333 RepID=UPI003783DAB5